MTSPVMPAARSEPRSLYETVAIRRDFLVGYQNRRYAARYVALVDRDAGRIFLEHAAFSPARCCAP